MLLMLCFTNQYLIPITTTTKYYIIQLNVDAFFNEYFKPTEDDNTVATMEGICHFAETFFKIDPMTDIRILVFLWKMIEGQGNYFSSFNTATLKKSSSLSSSSSNRTSSLGSNSRPSPSAGTEDKSFQPGHFSKEQFQNGCNKLNIQTELSLSLLLPTLDTGFLDKTEFRDFFKV